MVERLHCRFRLLSSARPVIPGTEVAIRPSWEGLCCHGGDGKWVMFCLWWRSVSKRVESSSAFRRKLEWLRRRCGMLTSRAIRLGWSSVLRSAFSLAFRIKCLLQVGWLWTLASSRKASGGVETSWPVISQREWFWRQSKLEMLVLDSQGCHAGAA